MIKIFCRISLLCCIISSTILGQETDISPISNASREGFAFNIRGKAFGFFILEDVYFATASIGGALIFKQHSLGIDGTYFRWKYETDDDSDVAMFDQYEKRKYLLIDYQFEFLEGENYAICFNSYFKTGNYKMWYKPQDFDLSLADSILINNNSLGTFNEFGMGVGYKHYFSDRFGFDLSANLVQRFSNTDKTTFSTYTISQFESDIKTKRLFFYARLNLFFKLFGES